MNEPKLIIDWASLPTYNTIMALLAGVALISIANFGKGLAQKKPTKFQGWSILFGVLGSILAITGAHMTLTWPLGNGFPWDNIIFGEPSFALGILLMFVSFYLWKNKEVLDTSANPLKYISSHFTPFNVLFYALGLMLTAIFFAGVQFQFFAAPPQEPISGYFSKWPWLEAWGLSLVFLGVGICSFFTPSFFAHGAKDNFQAGTIDKLLFTGFKITGWVLLLFGALNYYTHIGLILNTVK